MLTIGSLFSGIGGLDLGLEWATGGRVAWLCENDAFCREVLAKHWPSVPCYDDVRCLDETTPRADILCGGFPCQDISLAGRGGGIEGEQSGLWYEFARVIRLLRPRFIFVENVAALSARGLDRVLGDLASSRYDAEWDCIGACCVGAPHRRERLFILACDANRDGESALPQHDEMAKLSGDGAHTNGDVLRDESGGSSGARGPSAPEPCLSGWWPTEPSVDRVAHGVPRRVDRLRALGNAVVPAQAAKAWEILSARFSRKG